MNVPLAQTHFDSAALLFRQRQGLLDRPEGDAANLVRLERRLRLHLHVLARCQTEWPEPLKAADAFVWLAAGLSAMDSARAERSRRQALVWLKEEGPRREGAFAALALFPPADEPQDALTLFRENPKARPSLFHLWRAQGVKIPAPLLNLAELQSADPALQEAAYNYAADRPEIGLDLFRSAYRRLLDATSAPPTSPGVLAAALRGGLLRGDPELARILLRAIELTSDPQAQANLLRLAALHGDSRFFPVLRRAFARNAQGVWNLLALHGSRAAIADLLESLSRAETMEPAALAWQRLTGVHLARQPRLRLAGEERAAPAGGETMPDTAAARTWWQARMTDWAEGERSLCGQRLSSAGLRGLLASKSGRLRADLLDLLALTLKRPLGFTDRTWLEAQTRGLKELESAFKKKDDF